MSNRRSHALLCAISLALVASCALEPAETIEADVGSNGESLRLNRDCNDKLEDIYTKPNNLPSYNQSRRGEVVRCAKGRIVPVDEASRSLVARNFTGIVAKYAVQLLRITYRTERLSGQPDLSSAILLVPVAGNRTGASTAVEAAAPAEAAADAEIQVEVEVAGGGRVLKRPPLVVFAHGTVPYGQKCAYSRYDPTLDPPRLPKDTELGSLIALATRGYPVLMSDYAGFVTGSRVAGYLLSPDEAHSLLDGTRAVPKLTNLQFDSVVFLGHSQGGHAVLSAQALAQSYGLAGRLVGVAAFAPFWATARTFGALVAPESMLNTLDNPGELSFAIEYFYSHGEVYDGAGGGTKLFLPKVGNALKKFTSSCNFFEDPSVLGLNTSDFFKADFLKAVGNCGLFGDSYCTGGLAGTWEQRFKNDRPTLDPRGAPIVMWHGANDLVIPPPFAKCAIDKIRADLPANGQSAKFTFCGDPMADHETLLARDLAWVMRWIDARAFGAPEPDACPGEEALPQVPPLACPELPGDTGGIANLTGQRSAAL